MNLPFSSFALNLFDEMNEGYTEGMFSIISDDSPKTTHIIFHFHDYIYMS